MGFFDNVKKAFGLEEKDDVESPNNDNIKNKDELAENKEKKEIHHMHSEESVLKDRKTDEQTGIRNFRYLDELIHSGVKEIVLDSDIVLGEDEKFQYLNGIKVDVDDLAIDGNGHTIDSRKSTRIFYCTGKNVTIKNIILKNGHIDYNSESPRSEGGLIKIEDRELEISGSKLTDSSAKLGGAIFNEGNLHIKDSILSNNYSEHSGGTVENEEEKNLEVHTSKENTKEENIPNPENYSLQVANDLDTFEKLIEDNFKNIELDSDLTIGEMEINADNLTIDGKGHTIYGRGSKGILEIAGKNITFKNTIFEGGLWGGNGQKEEKNRERRGKMDDIDYIYHGGAIFVKYSGECTFIKCEFKNNTAGNEDRAKILRANVYYDAKGGAIYSRGTCRLLSCKFSGNKAIAGTDNDFYGCEEPKPTNEHTYSNETTSQKDVSEKDQITVKTLHKAKGTDNSFTIRGKIENLNETPEGYHVELTNTSNHHSTGQIPVTPAGTFMIELSTENPDNSYELKLYDSNNDLLIPSSNSSQTITYTKIDETKQIMPQNFKYLDNLIHFGEKKIKLDCDIILDEEEYSEYKNGIVINANNIVIDGNGHTISAKGKTRIFKITGQEITLKNITLKDGNAEEDGGAIYNLGKMTLEDSTITQNTAEYGGAIHNDNGSIILQNNTITENSASWFGGAIHNDNGSIILQNNKFGQNKARFYGGAISNWGEINAKNDQYIENSSREDGGAVYNNYEMKLNDCEFSQNHCLHNIIFNKDPMEIYKTRFNLNESEEIIFNISNATLYAEDCIFKDNSIEKSIINNNGKSCTLKKCIFDNELSNNTKSIINQTDLTFENSKINDSKSILNNGQILIINSLEDMEDKIEGKGNIEIYESISNDERFDFGYLDNLIHNSKSKKIILEEDITFENYEKNFYEGGIELNIDDLTIDGNGNTIDGMNKSRIFIITGNNITLKNIVFKNGKSHKSHYDSPNNHGGALKINNENKVKIENCKFISNTSEDNGGAISNEKGSVTIKNTEFNANGALNGGAIRNGGTCIIQNISLDKNHASLNGGTIYNKGKLTIKNSEIKGSAAKKYGGTIYNDKNGKIAITETSLNHSKAKNGGMIVNFGNTTIKDSKIMENQAEDSGGAIINNGIFNINNSTLKSNHANNNGGAIDNSGELKIKDSTLSNSSAKKHGGAVHNDENGMMTIINTTIKENLMEGFIFSVGVIKSYGGAISNKGELTLKDSILTDNKAEVEHHVGASSYCEGGAIHNTGKLKITSCKFKNNTSEDGGAIYGPCTINKSTFENNHSRFHGGAIYGTCTVNNSEFSNNSSSAGGAIYGKGTANNTIMTGNTAQWDGGAIYISKEEDFKLYDCEIHDNEPNDVYERK
ncbi:hypothetical protein [Methanobrevibacter millerae]|uniref:Polymorphic outer membrane protein repeat-containing protein n=1 Tax=Methanobrevibacter millerae TaxID=230361 RepID=A0A1G5V6G1_9EURY|nr:hypothetical protein [Methanobrevibacter millerae]SDA41452.1 polymorphic outer membrane protein repeat-containing protein [Methanobrevibacter millerae]